MIILNDIKIKKEGKSYKIYVGNQLLNSKPTRAEAEKLVKRFKQNIKKRYVIVEKGKRTHLSLTSTSKGGLYSEKRAFEEVSPNKKFEIVRVK